VVVIPKKNEEGIERISINTATLQELDTLPGIGPSIAQRIIDYRSVTPFSTIEQIKEVKGIGDKMFEKIKDLICL
jgi:competence protein ComEA